MRSRNPRARSLLGKSILCAAALFIATVTLLRSRGDPGPEPPQPELAPPRLVVAPSIAEPSTSPERTSAAAEPPPVDLEKCDRDLDLFGIVVDEKGEAIAGATIETLERPWIDPDQIFESTLGSSTQSAVDGTFAIRLQRGDQVDLRVSRIGFANAALGSKQAGERLRIVLKPACELRIIAKDERGAPVAHVLVRCWRDHTFQGYEFEGVTDSAGLCRFAPIESGRVQLNLDHAVLAGISRGVEVKPLDVTSVDVTFHDGRSIRGRVTDAISGQPIAGATIRETRAPSGKRVRTGLDGRYIFPGKSDDEYADGLFVVAQGYGREDKDVKKTGDVDFALFPADTARGVLLAPDRRPLPGVLVLAEGKAFEFEVAKTGGDGSFEITSLRHDLTHKLIVEAKGFGRYLREFPPRPGSPGTIELGEVILQRARAIEGSVVESNGTPLPDTTVVAFGPRTASSFGTFQRRRTDDLGRFRFSDLSSGSFRLSTQFPDRPNLVRDVDLTDDVDRLEVELRIPVGNDLFVRVVDEAGAPVSEASVSIEEEDFRSVSTNGEGLAALHGVQATTATIRVWADGFDTDEDPRVAPSGQEVRIVVHPLAEIAGKMVDETGAPVPDMWFVAIDGREPIVHGSDAAGAFRFRAKPGERVDLRVLGTHDLADGSRKEAKDETGYRGELLGIVAPAKDVLLVARKLPRTGRVEARVVGQNGEPVEGAAVTLSESTPLSASLEIVSDARGRVTFEGLVEGEYSLVAHPPKTKREGTRDLLRSSRVTVSSGSTGIVLPLREGIRWSGRVVDASGAGVEGVRIMARALADRSFAVETRSESSGRFTMQVLAGAHFEVSAREDDSHGARPRHSTIGDAVPEVGDLTLTIKE